MKSFLSGLIMVVLIIGGVVLFSYNGLVSAEERVTAQWSQVLNQFERRADLIPNLVSTVKGYSAHEVETFLKVVEARSKSTQSTLQLPDDSAAMKNYMDHQNELTGALKGLTVLVERYPELKSNENFLSLQAQLEGTENRIAVARRDYIDAVRQYNTRLRTMLTCWVAEYFGGFQPKATFDIPTEKMTVPQVQF